MNDKEIAIYTAYKKGESARNLSFRFNLTLRRIHQIIKKYDKSDASTYRKDE